MKEQLVTQNWGSGWHSAMGYKNVSGESWPDPWISVLIRLIYPYTGEYIFKHGRRGRGQDMG
jgi:hypothetical protein